MKDEQPPAIPDYAGPPQPVAQPGLHHSKHYRPHAVPSGCYMQMWLLQQCRSPLLLWLVMVTVLAASQAHARAPLKVPAAGNSTRSPRHPAAQTNSTARVSSPWVLTHRALGTTPPVMSVIRDAATLRRLPRRSKPSRLQPAKVSLVPVMSGLVPSDAMTNATLGRAGHMRRSRRAARLRGRRTSRRQQKPGNVALSDSLPARKQRGLLQATAPQVVDYLLSGECIQASADVEGWLTSPNGLHSLVITSSKLRLARCPRVPQHACNTAAVHQVCTLHTSCCTQHTCTSASRVTTDSQDGGFTCLLSLCSRQSHHVLSC